MAPTFIFQLRVVTFRCEKNNEQLAKC